MKTEIINAIKEFSSLDKETGFVFDDEEQNFLKRISECKQGYELSKVRSEMHLVYCSAILNFAELLIDSFSNRLVDTKEYNNTLMGLGQKFNKINNIEQIDKNKVEKCKEIFNETWEFYIKLQKNERNIIKQSKKEMWEKLYPTWLTILSVLYINFLGWLFGSGKIILSIKNLIFSFIGWILIAVAVWFFIQGFIYGGIKRKLFKNR